MVFGRRPPDQVSYTRLGNSPYAYVRPHSSLDGFTPIEAHYGIRGHLPRPISPPRGEPGDSEPEVPFDYVFLDPENEAFPVLFPKAA